MGPLPIDALDVTIALDVVLYGSMESWEVFDVACQSLVTQDIFISISKVAEHPRISVAPAGVGAAEPVVDDALVRPPGRHLCESEEEELLWMDEVPAGRSIGKMAGVERDLVLVDAGEEALEIELPVESDELMVIEVRYLVGRRVGEILETKVPALLESLWRRLLLGRDIMQVCIHVQKAAEEAAVSSAHYREPLDRIP